MADLGIIFSQVKTRYPLIPVINYSYYWKYAVPFLATLYKWQYADKTLTLSKSINMRASLQYFRTFTFYNCYFLQYFVGTWDTLSQKHIFSGLKL